jgi:parvulin-like peptidyl-prolyl isomerase
MISRFVVLSAAVVAAALAAEIRVVEEIAAKVNGDIITRGELEQTRRTKEQELKGQGLSGAKLAQALREAQANSLSDQIDQLLLVQKAKDHSINVDADITRQIAELQVNSKISDPDKFHDWVREQTGMTFEDYRDGMKRQMLSQRVIMQEVGRGINVPEAELQKYYDEHKNEFVRQEQVFVSQILISTDGKTPEQIAAAEKKAKDVSARWRKGEKTTDLIREASDDPNSAYNSYQRGQLAKQIEDIVFVQKKGFVTDPIRTPTHFVVMRVEERYEAGQATFEEVKSEIEDRIRRQRMEPKIREYLSRLRTQAFLEIKDGYVDSGAVPGKDTRWHDVAQLKPQTTTKEEVASRVKHRRKLLFVPIPGTNKKEPQKIDLPTPPPAPVTAPPAEKAPGGAAPEAAPARQ